MFTCHCSSFYSRSISSFSLSLLQCKDTGSLFLQNFRYFIFLQFFGSWLANIGKKKSYNFCTNRNLLLSRKTFFFKWLAVIWIKFVFTQWTYHENFLGQMSDNVSYIFMFIKLFLWMHKRLFYCYFWNIGLLTSIVSSFSNPEKSRKHISVPKLLLKPCIFMYHLLLKPPGNFEKEYIRVMAFPESSKLYF